MWINTNIEVEVEDIDIEAFNIGWNEQVDKKMETGTALSE